MVPDLATVPRFSRRSSFVIPTPLSSKEMDLAIESYSTLISRSLEEDSSTELSERLSNLILSRASAELLISSLMNTSF